jgi:hypothetical protein
MDEVAIQLVNAMFCADCEAIFNGRRNRVCPACTSTTMVPVGSLINKESMLANPFKVGGDGALNSSHSEKYIFRPS